MFNFIWDFLNNKIKESEQRKQSPKKEEKEILNNKIKESEQRKQSPKKEKKEIKEKMSNLLSECILMERTYYKNGVHTKITFPDGDEIWSAERPWKDNKKSLSCIPEGEYLIGFRRSPVVERTSGGDFTYGYEIENVPNRSYIMFHVGNWPLKDSDGCVLIGEKGWNRDDPVVWSSRKTFKKFMQKMNEHEISQCIIQTPEDQTAYCL